MRESTQSEIELKGINAYGLEKMIEIIYTSHASYDSYYDLFEIVATANHLQCFLVIQYCEQKLLNELNFSNLNHFILMAKIYNMKSLLDHVDSYLTENIAHLAHNSSNDYFLKSLNYEKFANLLLDNRLKIKEIDLFFLVWKWIYENLIFTNSKRKKMVNRLDFRKTNEFNRFDLSKKDENIGLRKIQIIRNLIHRIRFSHIKPYDLVNKVQNLNNLMLNDRKLRKLVVDSLNYHLIPNSYPNLLNEKLRCAKKCMIQIGGREINPLPSLHDTFSSIDEDISNLNGVNLLNMNYISKLPYSLSHMQCVVDRNNFLYVLGGCVSQVSF